MRKNAVEAYRSLNIKNNLAMTLEPPEEVWSGDNFRASNRFEQRDNNNWSKDNQRSDRPYNKPKGNWNNNAVDLEDIETSVDSMFDVYGNEIAVLYSSKGEVYVPLEAIQDSGFQLFPKPLEMRQSNDEWCEKLRSYLLNQARLFIFMNKSQFKVKTVVSTIDSVIKETASTDLRAKIMMSQHSTSTERPDQKFNKSNGSDGFDSADGQARFVRHPQDTLELQVPCEVQILSKQPNAVFYVRRVDKEDVFSKICYDTICEANASSRVEPSMNKVVAAKFENIWHRGCLYRMKPAPEFFFIDLGKFVMGKPECRSLSSELTSSPGLAIRVKVSVEWFSPEEGTKAHFNPARQYSDNTFLVRPIDRHRRPPSSNHSNEESRFSLPKAQQAQKSDTDGWGGEEESLGQVRPKLNPLNPRTVVTQLMTAPRAPPTSYAEKEEVPTLAKPKIQLQPAPVVVTPVKTAPVVVENAGPKLDMSRKSVADCLQGTNGSVECMELLNDNTFIAFIFPMTMCQEMEVLEEIKDNIKFDANYRPSVGETVVAEYKQLEEEESTFARAVVLEISKNSYKVAIIDYGVVIEVDKIMKLLPKFSGIVEYTAHCKVDDKTMDLVKNTLRFDYQSTKNGEMTIDVDGKLHVVKCKRWNPFDTVEPKVGAPAAVVVKQDVIFEIAPAPLLAAGDVVMLIHEENGYLSLRTRDNATLVKSIISELQAHKAEKLDTSPVVDQYVLHKVEGELFRAIVKVITGNLIKVFHVDYGKTAVTPDTDLYYIDKFAKTAQTITLAKLKGFEAGFQSRMVQEFLKSSYKSKFTVIGFKKDIVELKMPNNVSLTQKLTLLDKPPYKCIKDMPASPKLPVGGKTRALLMHILDLSKCTVSFNLCEDSLQEQFLTLSEDLQKCERNAIPLNLHFEEVCVGKYEESWCRAHVVEIDSERNQYLVYYFDFGNYAKVTIDDLRELPEEMSLLGPQALNCRIHDIYTKYGGSIPENILSKLREELQECESYDINVIAKNGNVYDVTIPAISSLI